jgi:hypothetical protein
MTETQTGVTFAGKWLQGFLFSTSVTFHFDVVLVTFDENESQSAVNHVYTANARKAVTNKGFTDNVALAHYSLLATLETNFGLGNLGKNDVSAKVFNL